MSRRNEPAVVRSYSDAFSAHVARSRLEAEGIDAFVVDENIVTTDPLISIAVGGVKVVVPEGDVEAAREILKDKAEAEESTCRRCGSSRLQKFQAGRRLTFFMIMLLNIPIGRRRNKIRCQNCQHSWRE